MKRTLTKAISSTLLIFSFFVCNAQTNVTNTGTRSGTQGADNSYYGFRSGEFTTDEDNSFYGSFSGATNTLGSNNSFFGFSAGRNNVDGANNTFLGTNTGRSNTSGAGNTFIGNATGRNSTTGNNNVFVGSGSGNELVDGRRNTFVGALSGRTATGNGSIFIGYQAGFNETRSNRLYIENSNSDTPLIYGNFNTDQLGINTNTIPDGVTFAVGGSMVSDALFANNRLAIGTTEDDPDYSLTVKGKIHVQEVKVDLLGAIAPDYVFEKDYELRSLQEVADYISKNGHLPNIPSASEMEANGLNLKEMNFKLLEKIEELTLYTIDLQDKLQEQKKSTELLLERLEKLESKLEQE